MATLQDISQETLPINFTAPTRGADIIKKAEEAGLDQRILYEAVIDLSAEGLLTANCINIAAGILLTDLGLPRYFFTYIKKHALAQLLQSIASSIKVIDGKAALFGKVAHIDFDLSNSAEGQRVRIATDETRDSMEALLDETLAGHRREYYFSPENNYHTYIFRAETVKDFANDDFKTSRFLYSLAGDYCITPETTRARYENFLKKSDNSAVPFIQAFNLPETGETRFVFNSDFEVPKLSILRKILADRGYTLVRAYWEPYLADLDVSSSVCSLYINAELTRKDEEILTGDLRDFLSFAQSSVSGLYLESAWTFKEMLFGGNLVDFTHLFIFKESRNASDKGILQHLDNKDFQQSFAKRIQESNKSTYTATLIEQAVHSNADLVVDLYALFEKKFDPTIKSRLTQEQLEKAWVDFEKKIYGRFIDYPLGYDIFRFMFKIITCTLKTNFFFAEKRAFSFRFTNQILDPLVFNQSVYGIFFVNGHYACGTHMRAGDIARGGLRLLRINRSNYASKLDEVVLLNYALGPEAQRIKHKDICESGSKGVVVPHVEYARASKEALCDYTEGIMDLILLQDQGIVDYYEKSEMIFFGPDEGTAQLMDAIALRAKDRGCKYWRTLTTGKSFGIPHDTYGLLDTGDCFGLFDQGAQGVELQINGESIVVTNDMEEIYTNIGGKISVSGMTTSSVMSAFRAMLEYYGTKEESLNLMISGGPDGDLGANQIQSYKGKICLIIDGGSVLYDPAGLDKKELVKLSFSRNTVPRQNSLSYPKAKLGPNGFMVPLTAKNIPLPDGTIVEDGMVFHRTFLTSPNSRNYLQAANIGAFIPCGGFKDTLNQTNIDQFLSNFKELQYIAEGANVFFDDSARRYIATNTSIKQIKDSSANKGGVFSSSIAEVLTAFLFGDEYEDRLMKDTKTLWGLIKDIILLVERYAKQEALMLIKLHEANQEYPLFTLSEKSSECIFDLQDRLVGIIPDLRTDKELVKKVFAEYVPAVLVEKMGIDYIIETLLSPELEVYGDAILTKKLASMAYYQFGEKWNSFLTKFEKNPDAALGSIITSAV